MTVTRIEIERVLELERELQTPAARADVARLGELLDPEFIEIGASGRRWDRDEIVDLLVRETTDPDTTAIGMTHLEGRALGVGVIQVFWVSDRDGRRARRTSLWRRGRDGWRQVYHQGTPLP